MSHFRKMEPLSEAALAADWKWGCGGRSHPPVPTNIPSSVYIRRVSRGGLRRPGGLAWGSAAGPAG